MPYATQAALVERFGQVEIQQLSDREHPAAGAIVAAVVDRALSDADGVIHRFLGGRFPVPLPGPAPAEVVRVACDIARYFLYDLGPSEAVRQHYEDALAWLRAVADGKLPLLAADGSLVPPRAADAGAFGPSALAVYPPGGRFGEGFADRMTAPEPWVGPATLGGIRGFS